MFRNPYYTGKINVEEDGVVKLKDGNHPVMVSDEDFQKVQLISQRKGYRHVSAETPVSLKDLIVPISISGIFEITDENGVKKPATMSYEVKTRYNCISCRYRFNSNVAKPCPKCSTPYTKDTKVEVFEYISHLTQDPRHPTKRIAKNRVNLKIVEEKLRKVLDGIQIPDDLFELYRRQLYTLWLRDKKEYNQKIRKLEDEKMDLEARRDNQLFESTDLGITPEKKVEINEKIMLLESDIERKEDVIEEIKLDLKERFERAWGDLQIFASLKNIFNPDFGFEPKKALLLSVASNLIYTINDVEVVLKKPYSLLAKQVIDKRSGGAGPTNCKQTNSNGSPCWTKLEPHYLLEQCDELLSILFDAGGFVESPLRKVCGHSTWKEEVEAFDFLFRCVFSCLGVS